MERSKKLLTTLLLVAFVCTGYSGDKSSLKWMSFTEGLAQAKKTNKKVLVEVYTDWCGWCKKMDKETYANAGVAEYLSKYFVVVKLDAESSNKLMYNGEAYTEQELADAFGITGYPSIIFLKVNGDPITTYPGYADAVKFKKVISFIAEDHYLTKKFEDYIRTVR